MIAEMHWRGLGVPQDRELGYAWMDLAAERMYPNFVIKRERYWQLLDADQRRNAIERGQQLLAEYGDDAAKPRSEEHTSELQSLMRTSYAVLCLKKKTPVRSKTKTKEHK